MDEWNIKCEAIGPECHDEALADHLIDSLRSYAPAVSIGCGRTVVRFDLEAESAPAAFNKGWQILTKVYPTMHPSQFSVGLADALERKLAQNHTPELLRG